LRILVTGAAGFLGRHVVASALRRGDSVLGIDSFITSVSSDLAADRVKWDQPIDFESLDVRSQNFVNAASGFAPDVIFHLACPTGVPNLGPLAEEMLTTSFDGTRNVLAIAERSQARIVIASSAEVYGDPQVSPQAESYTGNVDTLGPRNGYEEGKRVAETLAGIAADSKGIQVAIARIFNTYGPGMSLDDTRVVPAFVKAALQGRDLTMHGEGVQLRCHCYVSDTVDGLWRIALEGAAGRAYNLGSTVQLSVAALAAKIVMLAGSDSRVVVIPRPDHDHQTRLPDIGRISDELGWRAKVSLEAGLRKTIADFASRIAAGT
jgi:UDP-glucuronate decarboxylase